MSSAADGFKYVLNTKEYLDDMKNELTGRRIVNVPTGQKTNMDGTVETTYEQRITNPDPDTQLMNDAAADYVIGQFRLLFNPHVAMGNLGTNRECALMAGKTAHTIFAVLVENNSIYGISESKYGMLLGKKEAWMYSIYIYMTALRDGNLMTFGRETTSANYTSNQAQNSQRDEGLKLPFGRN